ncbi:MAG: hypothetical protein K2K22_02605 [Muribaculaceae bacterium]|nr:hypothetical protein [Muribaculaceae bacterium]
MKPVASFIPALLTCFAASGATTNLSLDDIAARMAGIDCYTDSCTYDVLLASLSEPVSYHIALESKTASSDTLSPCDYIIRWNLRAPSGISSGFSAYFDGSHFRFRDKRLQEYHAQWSTEPFAPADDTSRGVQCQAQFCELLPQFMAEHFRKMAADSTYIYTIKTDVPFNGRQAVIIEGVRRVSGYDGAEYTYVLDAATLHPLKTELDNNPGQIGEQSIEVTYGNRNTADSKCSIDMATLMSTESEAFEKFRESTFSLESLPGRVLPEIAAPTTTGERYLHQRGDSFASPPVTVFLDTTVGSTPTVVADVREAIAMLPMQVDVIWAFLDHRIDDVEGVVARPLPGEHLLMHATGAARDCGVGTSTPTLIFVNADGTVADYINGYNQDLMTLVIQKASMLRGN